MTTASAKPLRWIKIRLGLVTLFLTAMFVLIAYKAWSLQIRDGAKMRALGEAQYRHEMLLPAPRGSIQDRNGVELAVSVDGDSVEADPRAVVDVAGAAAKLAKVLKLDVRELEEKLASDRHYVWIARRISPDQARRVRELALPGVQVVAEPRRFYPGFDLAGPLLGFADLDGRGLEGVELHLDAELRGERARLPVVRDGRGHLVLAEGWYDGAPAPGELGGAGATVTLTIDRFIQFAAERTLADAVREHKAKAGTVVVLDPKSGEVLALATYPTYDPNDPRDRGDARNRAVVDAYEPGSVMKVFTIASAVEAGAVKPTDVFDVEGGRLQVGRKTVVDTHKGEHWLTVGEIMKYSSNVGVVKIARKLGRDAFARSLRAFGFGSKTGIQLPGERAGVVTDPKRWGEIGLATHAYGYGMMVTPLQLAAGLAVIANGGEYVKPSLVKRIVAPGGRVVYENDPERRRLISKETAAAVTDMLELVFQKGGTADDLAVPGFVLAGKTGTAYKLDPKTRRYALDRYLSSFMGFAPADDPRVVLVVMIDEPSGKQHFGGKVAGPVFARLTEETLKYLGVPATEPVAQATNAASAPAVTYDAPEPPPDPEPEAILDTGALPPAGPNEPIVMIPDFAGMSVAQAIQAARAAGVKLEIDGTGRAVSQFPAAGRAVKSITCRVTFDPM